MEHSHLQHLAQNVKYTPKIIIQCTKCFRKRRNSKKINSTDWT